MGEVCGVFLKETLSFELDGSRQGPPSLIKTSARSAKRKIYKTTRVKRYAHYVRACGMTSLSDPSKGKCCTKGWGRGWYGSGLSSLSYGGETKSHQIF